MSKPSDRGAREQSGNRAIGQRSRVGSNFRSMALWKESQDFAQLIVAEAAALPRNDSARAVAWQLVRAAGSIPANIAEGYGRFSQPAYRNHLSVARGSAFEVESWLDLLIRCGFMPPEKGGRLLSRCVTIQRMLTTRMKELGSANLTYAREEGDPHEA